MISFEIIGCFVRDKFNCYDFTVSTDAHRHAPISDARCYYNMWALFILFIISVIDCKDRIGYKACGEKLTLVSVSAQY